MLEKEIKKRYASILIGALCFSCTNKGSLDHYTEIAGKQASAEEYQYVLRTATDTLKIFEFNRLPSYRFLTGGKWYLDSLIAFNSAANRFITAVLYNNLESSVLADGIQYLYGEKIDGKWYFFKGPSVVVPREMVKGHDVNHPLSYNQLHQIALSNIYSGYLKWNGEINEDWFKANFEGPGWGVFEDQHASDWILHGKRFANRDSFFQFAHMEVIRNNWNGVKKASLIP